MKYLSAIAIALVMLAWACTQQQSDLSVEDNREAFFGGWQEGGASYAETVCVWDSFVDYYRGEEQLSREINRAFNQDTFDVWVSGLLIESGGIDCLP